MQSHNPLKLLTYQKLIVSISLRSIIGWPPILIILKYYEIFLFYILDFKPSDELCIDFTKMMCVFFCL